MTTQKSTSVADIIVDKRLVVRKPIDVGVAGTILWEDPNTLHIDHASYQRDTNEKHAMKIGENYRYDRAKVISGYRKWINRALNQYIIFVTDGQHSSLGAALAGIPLVPVYVFDLPETASVDDVVKLQSAQFVAINKNQKSIQKYDEYRNDLIQGEKYALDIDKLCTKHSVELVPATCKRKRGTMSHIHNLQIAYHSIGLDSIDFAFGFMRKFWDEDQLHGGLFIGLARFFKKFDFAQARGVPNSAVDPLTLFNALSMNGTRNPKEADEWLKSEYFDDMGGVLANKADAWRAKAIRMAYDSYIDLMGLDSSRKLTTKAVG